MALNIILSLMELVDILLKDTGQITQKEKRKEKKSLSSKQQEE